MTALLALAGLAYAGVVLLGLCLARAAAVPVPVRPDVVREAEAVAAAAWGRERSGA